MVVGGTVVVVGVDVVVDVVDKDVVVVVEGREVVWMLMLCVAFDFGTVALLVDLACRLIGRDV